MSDAKTQKWPRQTNYFPHYMKQVQQVENVLYLLHFYGTKMAGKDAFCCIFSGLKMNNISKVSPGMISANG